ncbi:hypothetical protein [[Phormidium] sp. ETS-05]|nr:hypothetical protein [[Phormidium] sp. ETS-05]
MARAVATGNYVQILQKNAPLSWFFPIASYQSPNPEIGQDVLPQLLA